jgi:transposase
MDVVVTSNPKPEGKHMKTEKYVGLDVHKDTTVVAVADGGRQGEVRLHGTISSDLRALEKALKKIGGEEVKLHMVYEAGPTGYVVYRRLKQLGIDCMVVAPSRIPQANGARQKNDRRDATMLARLHRAGELTAIHIPEDVDEAIRDLTRARADAVHDLCRAKQRLKSFLLRQGLHYPGKASWSEEHQRYLRALKFPIPSLRSVLEEYLFAFDQIVQRVQRLEELLAVHVPQWRMYPAVQALMCMRGFRLTAAAMLVAELGDIRRFSHPRHVMAFLGLVPKQNSTGQTTRMGAITKAGNPHARWILVEVVQHALMTPKVSRHLSLRQEGQPAVYRELSWKAQVRLHKRGWHLLRRGVMKAKVNIAMAREMVGFIWDLLCHVPERAV